MALVAWDNKFKPNGIELTTELILRIAEWLGQPTSRPFTPFRPCTIDRSLLRDEGRMVDYHIVGVPAEPQAWVAMARGSIDVPGIGTCHAAYHEDPPAQEADSDARILYHCTSVQNGLAIMKCVGQMRILVAGRHSPDGIYCAKRPAPYYDQGCQVQLRVPGCVIGKSKSRQLCNALREPLPLGAIAVIRRSVEEWVCHPQGCEVAPMQAC